MSIQKAKCDPLFKADAGHRTSQNTAGESPAPLSNEELAIQVKAGDRLAIAQLWKQVQCLTYWHALRFFNAHRAACASSGVEIEDVQQNPFLPFWPRLRHLTQKRDTGLPLTCDSI